MTFAADWCRILASEQVYNNPLEVHTPFSSSHMDYYGVCQCTVTIRYLTRVSLPVNHLSMANQWSSHEQRSTHVCMVDTQAPCNCTVHFWEAFIEYCGPSLANNKNSTRKELPFCVPIQYTDSRFCRRFHLNMNSIRISHFSQLQPNKLYMNKTSHFTYTQILSLN